MKQASFYIEPRLREEAIEVLKDARTLIQLGRASHVCYAVIDVMPFGGAVRTKAAMALREQIMASILPYMSVSGWLKDQIGSHAQYNTDMRVYRMAWIDEMIAQIRAMG